MSFRAAVRSAPRRCRSESKRAFTPIYPDVDAHYDADLELDLSDLEPQIALPGGVQHAVDVHEVAGQRIDHVFLGSRGSSMYEDLTTAAAILKGRRIAPHVRMFIAPGPEQSTRRMAHDGTLQIFIEAGAVMLPAGCGPCNDAVIGPVHSGECPFQPRRTTTSAVSAQKTRSSISAVRRLSLHRPSPARSVIREHE
jgi:3-isopropylmalate/(R)-2-methylmalate dehydratase large subunit